PACRLLPLHDALPILAAGGVDEAGEDLVGGPVGVRGPDQGGCGGGEGGGATGASVAVAIGAEGGVAVLGHVHPRRCEVDVVAVLDRKSTRLNSSHVKI